MCPTCEPLQRPATLTLEGLRSHLGRTGGAGRGGGLLLRPAAAAELELEELDSLLQLLDPGDVVAVLTVDALTDQPPPSALPQPLPSRPPAFARAARRDRQADQPEDVPEEDTPVAAAPAVIERLALRLLRHVQHLVSHEGAEAVGVPARRSRGAFTRGVRVGQPAGRS